MMMKRFLGAALITTIAVFVTVAPATFANDVKPQVGHLAPDFTFKDLDGNSVSLSDFRGRPVFFSPWFTGCPVCQREMVEWQAFFESFGDLISILGINVADTPQVAADFMKQRGATFPTLSDPTGNFLLKYRVTKMPTMFFVDSEGVIQDISKVSLTADGLAGVFAEKIFGTPILPLSAFDTVDTNTLDTATGKLIDTNGDGQPDGARVDLDGNGTFEATVALFKGHLRGTVPDKNALKVTQFFKDGFQTIEVDLNADETPEIVVKNLLSDGTLTQITVDLDGDGTAELSFP